jgi:acetyl esterase/lipase
MKRFMSLLTLVVLLPAAPIGRAADQSRVLDVWPGKAPGETGAPGHERFLEQKPGEKQVQRLTDVSRPTITVHRPSPDKDTGAAVLICPGGGYNILAWDLEGEEVASWLNTLGVTGIVLKYRVPRRPGQPADRPPPGPLQDAQRALRLVRARAADWGIDPHRLGILGFSAGGHLAAAAATNDDRQTYPPIDDIDRLDGRPDFAVLVYPGYLTDKAKQHLAPDIGVTARTPPMFLVHASDDRVPAENNVLLYLALKQAGRPAELHVYAAGGHGFGLRPSDQPCSTWPERCGEWMRAQGFLKPSVRARSVQSPDRRDAPAK